MESFRVRVWLPGWPMIFPGAAYTMRRGKRRMISPRTSSTRMLDQSIPMPFMFSPRLLVSGHRGMGGMSGSPSGRGQKQRKGVPRLSVGYSRQSSSRFISPFAPARKASTNAELVLRH